MSKKKKKKSKKAELRYAELRKTVGYVYPYFKPYKGRLVWVTLFMLLSSSFEPLAPFAIKEFVEQIWVKQNTQNILLFCLALVGLFIMRDGFGYFYKYIREKMCLKVVQDIRIALYDHFMHLSVDHYDRMSTGEMMSRTQNDVRKMQTVIPLVIDFAQQVVKLVALTSVAFAMEWRLSLIAITTGPLTIFPIMRIGYLMKRITKKSLEELAVLNVIAQETYSGGRVVKAFSMEDKEVEHYTSSNKRLLWLAYRYAKYKFMLTPMTNIIAIIPMAFVLYIAVKYLNEGFESAGYFTAFIASVAMMAQPIRHLGDINAGFQTAVAAAERIRETFEKRSTVVEAEDALELKPFSKEIRYEGINFKYDDEHVLRDFNLTVKRGELVALVGASGAGKTTIINLLPRFYEPAEGRITIDGMDIRKATFASLRRQIGIVTQETFLFNDTIENNIRYGSEGRTREEVIEAAIAANAHDFIMRLPGGYETRIGERGVRLSGGERQRLAIARALIKNAPILILDEATSSLDTEAEREVQKALDMLMRNRTTLAIAHRLSTVRHADKIIVISDGRLVEQGRHKELMDRNGTYKKLYEMQFFLGEYGAGDLSVVSGEKAV